MKDGGEEDLNWIGLEEEKSRLRGCWLCTAYVMSCHVMLCECVMCDRE